MEQLKYEKRVVETRVNDLNELLENSRHQSEIFKLELEARREEMAKAEQLLKHIPALEWVIFGVGIVFKQKTKT